MNSSAIILTPQNQRLRFFFKFWVLALLERTTSGFLLTELVNLNTTAGKRTYARLLVNVQGELQLQEIDKPDLTGYHRQTMRFSGDECSMWNESGNSAGYHLIVIGTGDIRNLTPQSDMDAYLWEWTLTQNTDMYFHFTGVNQVDIYSLISPQFSS